MLSFIGLQRGEILINLALFRCAEMSRALHSLNVCSSLTFMSLFVHGEISAQKVRDESFFVFLKCPVVRFSFRVFDDKHRVSVMPKEVVH